MLAGDQLDPALPIADLLHDGLQILHCLANRPHPISHLEHMRALREVQHVGLSLRVADADIFPEEREADRKLFQFLILELVVKLDIPVDVHVPLAALVHPEGHRIETILGHSERPLNPLTALMPVVAAVGIQSNMTEGVRLAVRIV